MPEADQLPVLVVGDVHGDLERLFQALKPYPASEWRTIFLGDLVDGGPFGVGVLRYARDRPNTEVLVGNHEAIMLAAVREYPNRGAAVLSWQAAGGEWHDMEALAADPDLQDWLRQRPALVKLEDGTLVQHCDSDGYRRLLEHPSDDPVDAVNEQVRRLLVRDDDWRLWDILTPRGVFRRRPSSLEGWLKFTRSKRVVHGHTPHRKPAPDLYGGGRAICFDGGFSRYGGGARFRRISPFAASVGPLPALPATWADIL